MPGFDLMVTRDDVPWRIGNQMMLAFKCTIEPNKSESRCRKELAAGRKKMLGSFMAHRTSQFSVSASATTAIIPSLFGSGNLAVISGASDVEATSTAALE